MYTVTKSLAQDFPSGLRSDLLQAQITAAGVPGLSSVDVLGDVVSINFQAELTQGELSTLDSVIAAHTPTPFIPELLVVVTIADGTVVVTEDQNWQTVAGMVGNPAFFAKILANVKGQLLGEANIVGTGAQIRLVEYSYTAGTEEEKLPPTAVAATTGWALLNHLTTVAARTGHGRFELQARLNGATSMSLRYLSVGLIEFI